MAQGLLIMPHGHTLTAGAQHAFARAEAHTVDGVEGFFTHSVIDRFLDDVRSNQKDNFFLEVFITGALEDVAQIRDIAQHRYLRTAQRRAFTEQAADNDGVAVFHEYIGFHGRGGFRRQGKIAVHHNAAVTIFGVQFHADVAIVHDERTEFQRRAGFQKFHRLRRRGLRYFGGDITIAIADEHLTELAVQGQHFGIAEGDDIGDAFQGADKNTHVIGGDADAQAAGADAAGETGAYAGFRDGVRVDRVTDIGRAAHQQVADITEVHAELIGVFDARDQNRGFHQHLGRTNVGLADNLLHLIKHFGIIRNHNVVGSRPVFGALNFLRAGFGRHGDLTFLAQHRRNQRLDVLGRDVIEPERACLHGFGRSLHGRQLFLGINIDKAVLFFPGVAVAAQHGFQGFHAGDVKQIHRHRAFDLRAGHEVFAARNADEFQKIGNVAAMRQRWEHAFRVGLADGGGHAFIACLGGAGCGRPYA